MRAFLSGAGHRVRCGELLASRTAMLRRNSAVVGAGSLLALVMFQHRDFPAHMYVSMVVGVMSFAGLWAWTTQARLQRAERLFVAFTLVLVTGVSLFGATVSSLVYYAGACLYLSLAGISPACRRAAYVLLGAAAAASAYRYAVLGGLIDDPATVAEIGLGDCVIVILAVGGVFRSYQDYDRLVHLRAREARERLGAEVAEAREAMATLERREAELKGLRGDLRAALAETNDTSAQLEASREQLEQFAYAASHDLREPVRTVQSFAQLAGRRLAARRAEDPRLDDYLRYIHESSGAMHRVLQRLLAFSRAGREDLRPERVSLREAVEAACAPRAAELDYEVAIGGGAVATVDPGALRRICAELIDNAVTFARPGERAGLRVSVAVCPRDTPTAAPTCELRFSDRGVGVAEEYREQAFGLFKRLHDRDTHRGSGIGLAFVRRLVDLGGGRVHLEGNAAGGADVVVRLPA